MQTDKNTVIGMVLLGILFFAYFYFSNQQQQVLAKEKQHQEDSLNRIKATQLKLQDTSRLNQAYLKKDTLDKLTAAGDFSTAALGTEQLLTAENDVIKVTFSNKGGSIKKVELKKYTSHVTGGNIILGNNAYDKLTYNINTGSNNANTASSLFFTAAPPVTNADNSQTISFSIAAKNGQSITHQYTIKPNSYTIGWNIAMNGADKLLSNGNLNMQWSWMTTQNEKSSIYERQMSNICFSEDNQFDYISSKKSHLFEKPVQWVGAVQQFFNTTLIAKNSFAGGEVKWERSTDKDTTNTLATIDAALQLKVPVAATANIPLELYYGPNEYHILKSQDNEMDKIINLGRDIYSFVRPVNKYVIMPVFEFFAKLMTNYGWAILLLTLFIRLFTAPLMYGSYLSGAKMKVLRPELDILKKKFGEDQQGFAMEQMKLFREAGVNPLGGCIPALLQIPIFFALYSFFNSNIALRGQSFLWSHDLSSYDVIATLPFSVPFGFGDHISLFTITAVLTSFAISLYNMGNTPTQDNPAMKYMPYIFPFMMLFFFNRLPSALTWYYTVSNTITLLLQFVIQTYIIDHTKILAKMQEVRTKPKTKSKWQERYSQVMESQKKLEDMKNKTTSKK
ncbi:membrane protein insertase YidC [Parasediminibacterium sp. JCM 36343]|uniref:membrane protein insertase YidC n=1 Tax=Parasediminibacterium sp. JCM 36343 TaxID=3374279 RepID=UPI00397E2858